MMSVDAWPVVFIARQNYKEHIYTAVQKAELRAATPRGAHVRRGARCILLTEDGELFAVGNVLLVSEGKSDDRYRFTWETAVSDPDALPALSGRWLARLQALRLTTAVTAVIISPSGRGGLDRRWFHDVERYALGQLPTAEKLTPGNLHDTLEGWLPPALSGLLADYVPTDQWEILVAKTFIALGCDVEVLGKERPGQPEPDCIARYTSPMGQVTELVIDAKAGRWGGAVDDLRAMRDYQASANPYTYPLFVANQLSPGVSDKLKAYGMNGRTAVAIPGRDLAVLVVYRLTRPDFRTGAELRRLFGAGG